MKQDINAYFLSVFHLAAATAIDMNEKETEASQWLAQLSEILRGVDPQLIDLLPIAEACLLRAVRDADGNFTTSMLMEQAQLATEQGRVRRAENSEARGAFVDAMPFARLIRILDSVPIRKRVPCDASPMEMNHYFAKHLPLLAD